MNKWYGRPNMVITLAALGAAGCSLFDSADLRVTATAQRAVASPEEPALIELTAVNAGSSRVSWQPGTSTCQLWLVVRVDGKDVPAGDRRVCTMDYVVPSLPPGGSRTEVVSWSGLARLGSPSEPHVLLEPGTYELRGIARPVAVSPPVKVELRAD